MRTLLFASIFAAGMSFSAPSLPTPAPIDPTITAAGGKDGGKKKKDEEKEEDYAVAFKAVTAPIS
jgi:hypothetical protein